MFDYCRAKFDFNNVEHIACSEIRAANLFHCSMMSSLLLGTTRPWNIAKSHANCVKTKAVASIMSVRKDMTATEAWAIVDKVFDKCYNDLEPVGRRLRANSKDMEWAYRERNAKRLASLRQVSQNNKVRIAQECTDQLKQTLNGVQSERKALIDQRSAIQKDINEMDGHRNYTHLYRERLIEKKDEFTCRETSVESRLLMRVFDRSGQKLNTIFNQNNNNNKIFAKTCQMCAKMNFPLEDIQFDTLVDIPPPPLPLIPPPDDEETTRSLP
ncbi:unnamed protein product, partial [Oppiella nova]